MIVSAPAKEPDVTVALGINFEDYDPEQHHIISNASCTTNCLAPVAKLLHESVGIRHGVMTTVHAYTGDQMLLDGPHKDYRRARRLRPISCRRRPEPRRRSVSCCRSSPGSSTASRFASRSQRDPSSISPSRANGPTSVEEVNSLFEARADRGELEGILQYSEEPLVSSDVVKSPYSSIFDAPLTTVVDGTQVKVVAWYDNEWGYSNRLVELAQRILVPVPLAA